MERANKHTVINMEMNNKLKLITYYNCKHFVCGGHTFDFLNSLSYETDFLILSEHWLYESEFYKLSSLGRSAGMVLSVPWINKSNVLADRMLAQLLCDILPKREKLKNLTVIICAALYTKDNQFMI